LPLAKCPLWLVSRAGRLHHCQEISDTSTTMTARTRRTFTTGNAGTPEAPEPLSAWRSLRTLPYESR
jgi:hypothetical protein